MIWVSDLDDGYTDMSSTNCQFHFLSRSFTIPKFYPRWSCYQLRPSLVCVFTKPYKFKYWCPPWWQPSSPEYIELKDLATGKILVTFYIRTSSACMFCFTVSISMLCCALWRNPISDAKHDNKLVKNISGAI
ncbi:uncharacterized protein LOC17884874 [Capsella rubella]|uniref:uncharacterized protein LOC17884874 n=1 Tax=Capsella rubella TaxID=81985 RepID=UPI000CD4EE4F|nr:uncharacterized protein LOC17884874 [Capsella rubella]